MKRSILALTVIALLAGVGVVAPAQEQTDGEDNRSIQVVTVYAQKVYPHRLGYRVIYYKSDLYPGEVFLPGRWFTEAASKGEIIDSEDRNVPYMHVYYLNGEFDHLRLYVHADRSHRSWGALPSDVDYTDEFSVDTLQIEY